MSSRIVFKSLPPDHPVYSIGIIIGGRIPRDSLTEETKKKENEN
jgi:hypothetical protein